MCCSCAVLEDRRGRLQASPRARWRVDGCRQRGCSAAGALVVLEMACTAAWKCTGSGPGLRRCRCRCRCLPLPLPLPAACIVRGAPAPGLVNGNACMLPCSSPRPAVHKGAVHSMTPLQTQSLAHTDAARPDPMHATAAHTRQGKLVAALSTSSHLRACATVKLWKGCCVCSASPEYWHGPAVTVRGQGMHALNPAGPWLARPAACCRFPAIGGCPTSRLSCNTKINRRDATEADGLRGSMCCWPTGGTNKQRTLRPQALASGPQHPSLLRSVVHATARLRASVSCQALVNTHCEAQFAFWHSRLWVDRCANGSTRCGQAVRCRTPRGLCLAASLAEHMQA